MPFVLGTQHLETCLDTSRVVQYELSDPLDDLCMRRIGACGRLAYYPDFPRPYFCVRRGGWFVVQGILGDRWLRVTYPPNAAQEAELVVISAIVTEGTTDAHFTSQERPTVPEPTAPNRCNRENRCT